MGVSKKGKRKLTYKGDDYYWYVDENLKSDMMNIKKY
jgi:hypothetical protein